MHPVAIRRSSVPKAYTTSIMLLSFPRSSLHLHSTISHTPCTVALQARTLWWWSRHGSEWNTPDEGLEERMHRDQKIRKDRCSKILRRHAMWEREGLRRPISGWRLPSRWAKRWANYKEMSSGKPLQAEVRDREKVDKKGEDRRPWDTWEEKWNKDFETFRSAVDKAIDRDPYGTLFGRHLRSPPTVNNSSWTSFSWIFEPARVRGETPKKNDIESDAAEKKVEQNEGSEKSSSDLRTTFSVPPISPKTIVKNSTSITEADYEYDPISMRKVPKANPETLVPTSPMPKKPFSDQLTSLFSEHGIEIPVKTYKPHKVYGYSATTPAKENAALTPEVEKPKQSKKGFESSRLRELQNLRAVTLGTSIDTTAEFGGKYQAKDEASAVSQPQSTSNLDTPESYPEKKIRSFQVDDEAPLFSGTTYQSRSEELISSKQPKNDWLLKEGFQTIGQELQPAPGGVNSAEPRIPVKDIPIQRMMESSLERMRTKEADIQKATTNEELQGNTEPSTDRMHTMQVGITDSERNLLQTGLKCESQDEKTEDIDLLRASDVRAAARTARKTKLDADKSKKEMREKLENDYISRQKDQNEIPTVSPDHVKDTTSTITKSFNNIWKHVREYPQGIVAKTIQSMGIFNDNYKNYIRLDKPTTDSTEKLIFKDQSLSKTPSIYKKVPKRENRQIQTFTPSEQGWYIDSASQARTAALRQASEDTNKAEAVEMAQASDLAAEIRNAYESQYGTIDINHRQTDAAPHALAAEESSSSAAKKVHPLKTASVKPGVERDMIVEQHINYFEPKLAELVDSVKALRKDVHETSLHIKAIRSKRPPTYWNARSMSESKLEADDKVTFAPQENVKSSPSVSEPLPTYVFLAYNPTTDRVEASSMSSRIFNRLPNVAKSQDLGEVLTSLKQPTKFMAHFEQLQDDGYELIRGGPESLVFKRVEKDPPAAIQEKPAPPAMAEQMAQRVYHGNWDQKYWDRWNKIAAEETAAQPISQPASTPKQAAIVLEEIPRGVDPALDPAVPSAASSRPGPDSRPVRRQETVFSGQHRQEAVAKLDAASDDNPTGEPVKRGFWAGLKRGVKRVVLTGLAMAGFTYTIGVVAEGVGAGRQQRMKVGEHRDGERRYVGRPGIFSTESSR